MPLTATWTDQEDEHLRRLVAEYGPKKWSIIAAKLKTKGSKQCRRRWKNYLNADLKSGGWTVEEDRILTEGHRLYGNKWTEIAKMVGGRTDNAVKNRWAALCKRDGKPGGRRGGGGGGGGRGGRKPRAGSDSEDAISDEEMEASDDAEDVPVQKRSSSFSSDSREGPSPLRGQQQQQHAPGSRSPRTRAGSQAGITASGPGYQSAPLAAPGAFAPGAAPVLAGGLYYHNGRSPQYAGEVRADAVAAGQAAAQGSNLTLPILPPLPTQASIEDASAADQSNRAQLGRRGLPDAASLPSVLGRRALSTSEQDGDHGLPLAKRRMLAIHAGMESYGSGSFREGCTPRTPSTPRLLAQLQEAAAAQQQQQLARPARHHLARGDPYAAQRQYGVEEDAELEEVGRDAGEEEEVEDEGEEALVDEQRLRRQQHQQLLQREGSSGAQAKKPPLTINIPNAASAEPANHAPTTGPASAAGGIEIRVLKDLLTPCEIQYARELNEMQLPLHINVNEEPPLSTSRQAAQNAMAALTSPGAGSMGEFSDVLKWFASGFTPRSSHGNGLGLGGTPRLGLGHLTRTGLTPRGIGSGCNSSPEGTSGMSSHGNTPPSAERTLYGSLSTRVRRQAAIAAAVAGAAAGVSAPCGGAEASSAEAAANGAAAAAAPGPVSVVAAGPFAGAELHAGHRQLLTKLIQGAVAAEGGMATSTGAGGGLEGLRVEGKALRLVPPSPTAALFSPGSFLATSKHTSRGAAPQQAGPDGGGLPAHAIVMTPHFSQQELHLLLEVLNSEDLQALPPPP